eukprot:TRINITY_DN9109_c2_g1_i1.p3 TRINITY_DN9109_c2_g1~~TRINITY_DN9109_c2_g1_i1.p3  ORF type:complete len:192 (+),score=55.58 TRINITY_DN9109_c2_g1_i1:573-1148(+)
MAVARAAIGHGCPVGRASTHVDAFMAVNKALHDGILETVPASQLGVQRGELELDLELSGVTKRGHRGAAGVLPHRSVAAALRSVAEAAAAARAGHASDPGSVDPVDAVSRQLLGHLSVHPCANGNGRTAMCMAVAALEWYGLPPAVFSPATCRLVRLFGGQVDPGTNPAPADAAAALLCGMHDALAEAGTA